MSRPSLSARLLAAVLFAGLAFAAFCSARQAWADALFRENTPESLTRAVSLEEGNAAYHELLGEHLEGLGQDPTPEFMIAARLSPRDARYWIRLSFFHEVQGKYAQAEQELLEADRVDRKFDPPWALMNFYFRRNNPAEFWRWTRRALEISYDDVSAIFRLTLQMDPDWRATEAVLPARTDVGVKFLAFLTTEKHAAGAGPLAIKVARNAQAGDVPALLAWCDSEMAAYDTAAPLEVWNTLSGRGLTGQKPLSPEQGRIVSSGDFSSTPSERGFDWRADPVDGASLLFPGDSEGLDLSLTGGQPEDCVLLWEPVPLTPGKQYSIGYSYKVSSGDETAAVGLHWEVLPAGSGGALGRSHNFESSAAASGWISASFRVNAGEENGGRLRLRYTRPPGSVRWHGRVRIRQIAAQVL